MDMKRGVTAGITDEATCESRDMGVRVGIPE